MRGQHHGQIACGTIAVKSIERSVSLYCDYLHQDVLEEGKVSPELATVWGAPNTIGARYAVLQPPEGGDSMLRLVQTEPTSRHVPAKSLGWNAFEFTVRDVFALAEALAPSDFDIVGPPRLVAGFTSFIPMQVFGPDGEVLFLNQVNHSDDDADLPKTQSTVGQIFIVVLASGERQRSVADYARYLNLQEAATHSLRYSLVNRAFDLPADTLQTITMVQNGRTPFLQVDQYPASATPRVCANGELPAGNAMVSVFVDSFDQLPLDGMALSAPGEFDGALYQGCRTQVIRGAASELIELIEIRSDH